VFFISNPALQQPQEPLLVPGVVYEPLEYELGLSRLERVRDLHLGSFRSVRWVHRSRRHDVVDAYPVQKAVLVYQVRSSVGLQYLVLSVHLGVEVVLPCVVAQKTLVTTGRRRLVRADILVIFALVPSLRIGSRVPHSWKQGHERLQ